MDLVTAGTSSSIAQFYHQLTGDDLRRDIMKHDRRSVKDEGRAHEDSADDDDDDEDNDDDTNNDEPCDLRLLTPNTCLQEIYAPSPSMVPYLPGTGLPGLAETLISNISKLPPYKSSPAGTSSTGFTSGMSTGSAAIPALKNIRVPGSVPAGSSGTGATGGPSGTSTSGPNQTTPGGAYSCHRCGNSYARPHSLNRHIRFECGVEPKFECPVCHKKSKHKHNLVLHMRTHQQR